MSGVRLTPRGEILEALGEYVAERTQLLAVGELDEQGIVVAANGPLERLAGGALIGVDARRLVAPAQREALSQALETSTEPWQQRLFGLTPDARGVPRDFAFSLRRLDRGWLLIVAPAEAMVSDVNERLLALNDDLAQAQRQINRQNADLSRQNDQLRELDQLKDELLANVSHDLRTPLTAILGYAELLRRRGGLTEKQIRAAQIIERNAQRLLRLVDDLLLLAQARAGQLRLEREPVDVVALAEEAFELMRPLAEQAALTLELAVPATPVAPVPGDRLRLEQLLLNLVGNAVKFTQPAGHVVVRVRERRDAVGIEVDDDGPGIPQADRARLYDPFVRGATQGVPGTGLGLAIVREVANAHEATIELAAEPGQGTRFTVWLRTDPAPPG